ncbi:putative Protein MOS2 [Tripterygium wilfordii]|uniref:Uncharacterized protein n=1 Tax=Tripterygium wilfordii TaxID=458696 RepID=A0A7J7DJ39_TRIWF|nr:putative Protein MOS2 [Tripterygium wilfordii]
MKLSFSKPSSKYTPTFCDGDLFFIDEDRQFLSEFDPSKPQPPHVIPPKVYEGQPLKLLPGLNISFGWNLKQSMKTDASVDGASKTHGYGRRDEWPPSVENISVDRLKDELARGSRVRGICRGAGGGFRCRLSCWIWLV